MGKVVTYISKGKVQTFTLEELRMMKIELTQQWEKVCRNCGKCCFDKSLVNNNLIINYDKPCSNLKFMGKRSYCEVYEDRFVKCEVCNTIPEAIEKRYLPADCPYIKHVVGYKAPVDNGNWFKRSRKKLTSFDSDSTAAGTPTGLDGRGLPASPPPARVTAADVQTLSRENLDKPKDWLRRRRERMLRQKGKIGILDPREQTTYNIKPSGHALGG